MKIVTDKLGVKCGPGNRGNGCLESLQCCLESWISFWSPPGALDASWNHAPKGPTEPSLRTITLDQGCYCTRR